jgi:RNA polymerase sigma factor (sigma-70 family)
MRNQIFISYSHADRKWLDRLNTYLRPLERDQKIISWSDLVIKPTQLWREEIQLGLDNAYVAILLISANFFASDFIHKIELPTLLEAAENSGTKIMSLIIGASRFSREPKISRFQAINDPNQPLESLKKHQADAVLQSVADTVEDLFMKMDFSDNFLNENTSQAVKTKTLSVEITIEDDFDKYNECKKEKLLRAIKDILSLKGDIRINHIRRGSVKITVELTPDKAVELVWAIKSGSLREYNVVDAELKDSHETTGITTEKEESSIKWEELYTRAYRILRNRYARNWQPADWEDMAQEAVLVAIKALSDGQVDMNQFNRWFVRVVENVARDQWRALHERRGKSPEVPMQEGNDTEDERVATDLKQVLASQDVQRLFTSLLPHERRVLELIYWYDLSSRDIAAVLGIDSGSTVRRWHKRMLDKLQKNMREP